MEIPSDGLRMISRMLRDCKLVTLHIHLILLTDWQECMNGSRPPLRYDEWEIRSVL